jgi:hypothetical protein
MDGRGACRDVARTERMCADILRRSRMLAVRGGSAAARDGVGRDCGGGVVDGERAAVGGRGSAAARAAGRCGVRGGP